MCVLLSSRINVQSPDWTKWCGYCYATSGRHAVLTRRHTENFLQSRQRKLSGWYVWEEYGETTCFLGSIAPREVHAEGKDLTERVIRRPA